ncbi:MAG: hypothetical protein HFJ99_07180 [Eubacterium sp.]|nr:hypothetical protein [Eubacterium sp.]
MNIYEREVENFRKLNRIAKKNSVVLLGSTFAKDIPVSELVQTFDIDCNVYNRSLTDLSVFDAEKLLDDCVISLSPKKILLQLGETDLERGYRTIPEILEAYEKIVAKLKNANKHCEIIIVSVCEKNSEVYPEALNVKLEELAKKHKCQYADISPAFSNDSPSVKAFSLLKYFMLDRLSFYDAMNLLNV